MGGDAVDVGIGAVKAAGGYGDPSVAHTVSPLVGIVVFARRSL